METLSTVFLHVGRRVCPRESRCLHAAYIQRAEGGVPLHKWGREERKVDSSQSLRKWLREVSGSLGTRGEHRGCCSCWASGAQALLPSLEDLDDIADAVLGHLWAGGREGSGLL